MSSLFHGHAPVCYTLSMNSWHVYILRCADDTLYTGITTDVQRRLLEHNDASNKKAAKYTRVRRPVEVVYICEYPDRATASREEYRIKQLSRKEKEELF
ncbi:MAG: putative endonuclease [Planctomycetota bacterium]|jgi:putative endonuclease